MKGVIIPPQVKELIIQRVKDGEKVTDLAKEFKVAVSTIRRWLSKAGVRSGNKSGISEALQISKLKREKAQLLEIIGELTVMNKQSKKKSTR